MAKRADKNDIVLILGTDYSQGRDLSPFCTAADMVLDAVVERSASDDFPVSTSQAKTLANWYAAHLYCCSDRTYTSRTTLGASGSFAGQYGMGLDATSYGQQVKALDLSGWLTAIAEKRVAGLEWLGKTYSEELAYDERN